MPKQKVTKEQIKFMLKHHKEYTPEDLAERFGLTRTVFFYYEKLLGIKFKRESQFKRMIRKAKEEL